MVLQDGKSAIVLQAQSLFLIATLKSNAQNFILNCQYSKYSIDHFQVGLKYVYEFGK